MRILGSKVLALCTAAERQLAVQAGVRNLARLSETKVRSLLPRARRLADKYRKLAREQGRKAQRARGARGAGAPGSNTELKADLFAAVAERFESRRDAFGQAPGTASGNKARGIKAKAGKAKARTPAASGVQTTKPASGRKRSGTAKARKAGADEAPVAGATEPPVDQAEAPPAPAAQKSDARVGRELSDWVKIAQRERSLPPSRVSRPFDPEPGRLRQRGNVQRRQGHVAARGRRQQARRDSRRR